jgi:hypothetical protein
MRWISLHPLCSLCALWLLIVGSVQAQIDFNRDIRPILSDNCFACHGPDKKKRKSFFSPDLLES